MTTSLVKESTVMLLKNKARKKSQTKNKSNKKNQGMIMLSDIKIYANAHV